MKLVLPLAICALLLFPGCKKNDEVAELKAELEKLKKQNEAVELEKKVAEIKGGTIKGSVFVVTKGGTNYKLGLVGVRLADSETAKSYISKIGKTLEISAQENKASYDKAIAEFEDANAKYEAAAQKYRQLEAGYKEAQGALEKVAHKWVHDADWVKKPDVPVEACSKPFADFIAVDKSRAEEGAKLAPLYANAEAAYKAVLLAVRAHLDLTGEEQVRALVSGFPEDQLTKTDADGEFSFTVDKGKTYLVAASAQRSVGKDVEQYYWVVPVTLEAGRDTATLMLSNDNMMDDLTALAGMISISSPVSLPKFEKTTIVTAPKKWRLTDIMGKALAIQMPEIPETKPAPVMNVDKTKFPRAGVARRRITVPTAAGISSVPQGAEIQLIAADGDGYKGTYNGQEFSLGANDFDEKP